MNDMAASFGSTFLNTYGLHCACKYYHQANMSMRSIHPHIPLLYVGDPIMNGTFLIISM